MLLLLLDTSTAYISSQKRESKFASCCCFTQNCSVMWQSLLARWRCHWPIS